MGKGLIVFFLIFFVSLITPAIGVTAGILVFIVLCIVVFALIGTATGNKGSGKTQAGQNVDTRGRIPQTGAKYKSVSKDVTDEQSTGHGARESDERELEDIIFQEMRNHEINRFH